MLANGARLTAQLINESAGTVTFSETGNGQTRLGTAGNAHVNRGLITVAAGTANYVYGTSLTNDTGGVIRVGSGLALDVTNLTSGILNTGGQIEGLGQITGNVTSGGMMSPGLSAGKLSIAGNYVQTGSGTLLIEIEGTTPGTDLDWLAVTGSADLDGVLAVEFLSPYFPNPRQGSIYDVLTAGSITTQPGFVLGGTWGDKFMWEVVDGTTLRLTSNIPEPASVALLALAGLAALRRRRG